MPSRIILLFVVIVQTDIEFISEVFSMTYRSFNSLKIFINNGSHLLWEIKELITLSRSPSHLKYIFIAICDLFSMSQFDKE